MIWVPEARLLVVAAGMGVASGLGGRYVDASPLAQAAVGYVAALLTEAAPDDERVRVVPPEASALVRSAYRRAQSATRSTGALSSAQEAISVTARAAPTVLADLLPPGWRDWMHGMAVELAVTRIRGDHTVEFSQAGSLALLRWRDGQVRRLSAGGMLADDYLRAGWPLPEGGLPDVVSHFVGFGAGELVGDVLSVTSDVRAGDRLLVATRGAHEHLVEADVCEALRTAEAAAERVVSAAARKPGPHSKHPTAAVLDIAFSVTSRRAPS